MSWMKQQQNFQQPQQQQQPLSVLGEADGVPGNFLQQQWPNNQLPPNYQQQPGYYQQPQPNQVHGNSPQTKVNNFSMQTNQTQQNYQHQNNNWESPSLHSGNVANNNLHDHRLNSSNGNKNPNAIMATNNFNSTNDGWNDWGEDWADNQQRPQQQQSVEQQSVQQQYVQQQTLQQQSLQQQPLQQQPLQQQSAHQQYCQPPPQQFQNNFVSIEDSFKNQPNDNWNWGIQEPAKPLQQQSILEENEQQAKSSSVPISVSNLVSDKSNNNVNQVDNEEKLENISNLKNSAENATIDSNNSNQNLYSGNQIYHSMKKPVVRPTRQFASPAKESLPFAQSEESQNVDNCIQRIEKDNNFNYAMTDTIQAPDAKERESHKKLHYDNTNIANNENLPSTTQNIANHQLLLPPPIDDENIVIDNTDFSSLPPPPTMSEKTGNNPFKRAGSLQRRNVLLQTTSSNSSNTFALSTPPPPPLEFQSNEEILLAPTRVENSETCSNDRNQYLQTSHLSEDGGYTNRDRQNQESDNNFPPPGLSRLVLGQPESGITPANNNSTIILSEEIPPGFDRMIPGTETSSSTNLERQADGQDTIPLPRSAFVQQQTEIETNIDITSDRNLYLVPGESEHTTQQLLQQQQQILQQQQPVQMQLHQQQRVVTGLDNFSIQNIEQRDVELDGENLEDIHQPNSEIDISSRNEPIEGANTLDLLPVGATQSNETESSLTAETHFKDYSNPSTANDESDNHLRSRGASRGDEINKRAHLHQKDVLNKKIDRYRTEETDSSGREENIRDSKEKTDKDRRRDKNRDFRNEKYRDEKDKTRRDRYDRRYRYETDSKYETEESRYEKKSKEDQYDRNYDEYEHRRDDKNRKSYRRGERDDRRSDRRRRDDRQENRHRDVDYYGRDKRSNYHHRSDRYRSSDYDDDYRKNSSRNARDSDLEKDSKRKMNDKDHQKYENIYGYPGYGYDPYAYYQQQQQYYEQLRRTNPQAYAEWYRKYFSAQVTTAQSDLLLTTTDGRESVHSGRSSANNDKDRYSNHHQYTSLQYQHPQTEYQHHFIQQANISSTPNCSMINEQNSRYFCYQQPYAHNLSGGNSTGNLSQHGVGIIHNNNGYLPSSRSYSYARSEYSESRPENLSLNFNIDNIDKSSNIQENEPHRLTPRKFTNDHSFVSISAGVLVCVKPKYSQNGVTNVVKILRMGTNDSTKRLFQSFPGPLVRGQTHKKTVIEFCEEQIRLGPGIVNNAVMKSRQNSMSSICSTNNAHVASFTLMWNLLILLLRQNGMVIGTDISELLMKNKTQFPNDLASKSSSLRSTDNSNKKPIEESNEEKKLEEPSNESDDSIDDGSNSSNFLSEEEITEKFRNHLLYGNVTEGLDWATDNNLWGHALFLASKVDKRSHANVMMKFANKLALNDPLQTLYQLMSGRTPSSVTSCQDEKWGDWRPHLAMILSNTSQKPELDRKAITTLGDTLMQRDDLFAAQFCYLMAQVGFGKYPDVANHHADQFGTQNSVRLILLGSSHNKPLQEFATNEAIMMTEIYEYACSLNDDKFSIVEFQPYKYLLASRLLDYGYQLKTLMYMEQIALHILRDVSKYDASFIGRVYNLAEQLKYYDPVLEKTMDDQNDENQVGVEGQKWLQDLNNVMDKGNLQPYPNTNYNYGEQPLSGNYEQNFDQNRAEIDQQFAQINQQFQQLSVQYDNFDPTQQNQNLVENINQPQQDIGLQPQFYNPNDAPQEATSEQNPINYTNYREQPSSFQQPTGSYELDQQQQQHQLSNPIENSYQQSGNYEYWDQSQQLQQQQQYQEEFPTPTISLPNSKRNIYNDDANNQKHSGDLKQNITGQQKQPQKSNDKNQNKSSQNNLAQNSGWFGGIWNKLSLKPKNQMILPDDKNPTIVWDPDKKLWVNTDGQEADENIFKPPPKMSDIMGSNNTLHQGFNQNSQMPAQPPEQKLQLNYGAPPSNIVDASKQFPLPNYNSAAIANPLAGNVANPPTGESAKTPSLQSNMFKMQRNKTLKKSYVDVFNPSGAPSKPVEPVLAPSIPTAIPQSGFLIPSSDDNNQLNQQQGGPQFYNPNQFSGNQQ